MTLAGLGQIGSFFSYGTLNNRVTDLEKQNAELAKNNAELAKNNAALTEQHKNAMKYIQELVALRDFLEKTVFKQKKIIEDLTFLSDDSTEAQDPVSDAASSSSSSSSSSSASSSLSATRHTVESVLRENLEMAEKQLKEIQAKFEKAKAELENANIRINYLENRNKEARDTISRQFDELCSLETPAKETPAEATSSSSSSSSASPKKSRKRKASIDLSNNRIHTIPNRDELAAQKSQEETKEAAEDKSQESSTSSTTSKTSGKKMTWEEYCPESEVDTSNIVHHKRRRT